MNLAKNVKKGKPTQFDPLDEFHIYVQKQAKLVYGMLRVRYAVLNPYRTNVENRVSS